MIRLPPRPAPARPDWTRAAGLTADMARILGLPFHRPDEAPDIDAASRAHLNARAYAAGDRLLPDQARALASFEANGNLFAAIGCGRGKSLTALRCEDIALTRPAMRVNRIVHFLPPSLLSQFLFRDIPRYRKMIPMQMDFHCLAGLPKHRREQVASSGAKGVYVFPYSYLSTQDGQDLLDAISPDMVVGDECHNLAGRASARVRRLMRHLAGREVLPRAALLSGTISSKKIRDYEHLALWALGERTFLPRAAGDMEVWGTLIDAEAIPSPSARAELAPMLTWARQHFPEDRFLEGFDQDAFRRAYHLRMASTAGVIISGDAEVGTSLTLAPRACAETTTRPGWGELCRLNEQLEEMWLTPSGDEIEHAIHKARWASELSAGFFNSLVWPTVEVMARKRGISTPAAQALLDDSKKALELQGELARLLRRFFETNRDPRLDTPFGVGGFCYGFHEKGQVPPLVPMALYKAWAAHHEAVHAAPAKHGGELLERDRIPVRVCDYKIVNAVAWAQSLGAGASGIIWAVNLEVAAWLGEALRAAGVPSTCLPEDDAVEDVAKASGKIHVLTVGRYSNGRNLQHLTNQLFVQFPRSAKTAEQALARVHRTGCKEDELTVFVDLTSEYDQIAFAATLNDSLYLTQSVSAQRLISADYDPAPRIFPSAVLKQRGLEAVELSARAAEALRDKFGA